MKCANTVFADQWISQQDELNEHLESTINDLNNDDEFIKNLKDEEIKEAFNECDLDTFRKYQNESNSFSAMTIFNAICKDYWVPIKAQEILDKWQG